MPEGGTERTISISLGGNPIEWAMKYYVSTEKGFFRTTRKNNSPSFDLGSPQIQQYKQAHIRVVLIKLGSN